MELQSIPRPLSNFDCASRGWLRFVARRIRLIESGQMHLISIYLARHRRFILLAILPATSTAGTSNAKWHILRFEFAVSAGLRFTRVWLSFSRRICLSVRIAIGANLSGEGCFHSKKGKKKKRREKGKEETKSETVRMESRQSHSPKNH